MFERVQITDVARIYELWNEYAAAFNTGDLEGLISLWTEGGLQMPPHTPCRVGSEAILEGMQHLFDRFKMKGLTIHTEEVRILGDQAYAHGTYEFDITPREGRGTRSYSGNFLDILEKQVDGSWKIAIDCHNYNMLPD